MSNTIVGRGGSNVAVLKNMGAFEAVVRRASGLSPEKESTASRKQRTVRSSETTEEKEVVQKYPSEELTHAQKENLAARKRKAVRERNLSYIMANIDVSPTILNAAISSNGYLTMTMVRHGQDLNKILQQGFLEERGRNVQLQARDLKEIIEDLSRRICKCADVGFAHLDIKSSNVVVQRVHRYGMKAMLIDWEPQFITCIQWDEILLKALEERQVPNPCEVLRCTYCIIMWALFYTFGKRYDGDGPSSKKFWELVKGELNRCRINERVKEILCASREQDDEASLVESLRYFVRYYLGIRDIINFFEALNIETTHSSGVAFGVSYDSSHTSAGESSEERRVFGDFINCPPPVSPQASSQFSIQESSRWAQEDFIPTPSEDEMRQRLLQAAKDKYAEGLRRRKSDRRRRRKSRGSDRSPSKGRSPRRDRERSNRR